MKILYSDGYTESLNNIDTNDYKIQVYSTDQDNALSLHNDEINNNQQTQIKSAIKDKNLIEVIALKTLSQPIRLTVELYTAKKCNIKNNLSNDNFSSQQSRKLLSSTDDEMTTLIALGSTIITARFENRKNYSSINWKRIKTLNDIGKNFKTLYFIRC